MHTRCTRSGGRLLCACRGTERHSRSTVMTSSNRRTCYALIGLSAVMCGSVGGNATTSSAATDTVPPGYSTQRTGSGHDFDYFADAWTTRQHRLRVRGASSTEWEDFPAALCMTLYLGGMATVDELYMPTKDRAGLTLRTFDSEKHQWSTAPGRPTGRQTSSEPIRQELARTVVRGGSAAHSLRVSLSTSP